MLNNLLFPTLFTLERHTSMEMISFFIPILIMFVELEDSE
jgi:hypothetical protein